MQHLKPLTKYVLVIVLWGLLTGLINEKEKTNHRIENNPPVPDFMDKLVDAYKSGKLSDESLKENTQVLIGAGSETTATALSGKSRIESTNRLSLQSGENKH